VPHFHIEKKTDDISAYWEVKSENGKVYATCTKEKNAELMAVFLNEKEEKCDATMTESSIGYACREPIDHTGKHRDTISFPGHCVTWRKEVSIMDKTFL